MLKITMHDSASELRFRLEGRLAAAWVGELRQVCETLVTEGRALKLDLTDVTFADADGVAVLTGFKTRGVTLKNCAPFVDEQLRSTAND